MSQIEKKFEFFVGDVEDRHHSLDRQLLRETAEGVKLPFLDQRGHRLLSDRPHGWAHLLHAPVGEGARHQAANSCMVRRVHRGHGFAVPAVDEALRRMSEEGQVILGNARILQS